MMYTAFKSVYRFICLLACLLSSMASYFDEHDCEPTNGSGPDENTLLRWARLLLNDVRAFSANFEGFDVFGETKRPPASKDVVAKLPDKIVSEKEDSRCPICLLEYSPGEKCKVLPCKHSFHPRCILPWLGQTNTCPVCRHELPTDDEEYEEFRREKARAKQREFEKESLHSSMYT